MLARPDALFSLGSLRYWLSLYTLTWFDRRPALADRPAALLIGIETTDRGAVESVVMRYVGVQIMVGG